MIGSFLPAFLRMCQLFPPYFLCQLKDQSPSLVGFYLLMSLESVFLYVSIVLSLVQAININQLIFRNFCLRSFNPFPAVRGVLFQMLCGEFSWSPAWHRSCFPSGLWLTAVCPVVSPPSHPPFWSVSLMMLLSPEVSAVPGARNTSLPLFSDPHASYTSIHPWDFILGDSHVPMKPFPTSLRYWQYPVVTGCSLSVSPPYVRSS